MGTVSSLLGYNNKKYPSDGNVHIQSFGDINNHINQCFAKVWIGHDNKNEEVLIDENDIRNITTNPAKIICNERRPMLKDLGECETCVASRNHNPRIREATEACIIDQV